MAVLKEQDFQRLKSRPDPAIPVVLIYGPDAGLVSERFAELVAAYSAGSDDPFAGTMLDAAEIDREPDRLINEALTVSMFGGTRVIGVRAAGSRTIDAQIEAVLAAPAGDAVIIVSAGDLKKSQLLRKRIEGHDKAVALPCYVDAAREIDRIIDEETGRSGARISREARSLLHSVLGADRLATRQELQKLCLYTAGAERIETADVEAVVADAAALALDDLIDAVAGGEPDVAEIEFDRLTASGLHPSMLAGQTLRHVQGLDLAVAVRADGGSIEDALRTFRPPIFYKRQDAVKRQIALWTGERIGRAANLLYAAIARGRKSGGLERTILAEALLSVARVGQALKKRR